MLHQMPRSANFVTKIQGDFKADKADGYFALYIPESWIPKDCVYRDQDGNVVVSLTVTMKECFDECKPDKV